MADILIKGMELPKDKLEYLHLIIQDGKVHTAISCGHLTTDKLNVATAIELPPHGKLKDADVIIESTIYCSPELHDAVVRRVLDAPTIVEASNGDNN